MPITIKGKYKTKNPPFSNISLTEHQRKRRNNKNNLRRKKKNAERYASCPGHSFKDILHFKEPAKQCILCGFKCNLAGMSLEWPDETEKM